MREDSKLAFILDETGEVLDVETVAPRPSANAPLSIKLAWLRAEWQRRIETRRSK